MQMQKLRVLTISKPYVAAAYRDKLAWLAKDEGMEVGLITPRAWGRQAFEGKEGRFWNEQLPLVLNGKNHFHLYRGLTDAVRRFRPDVMNIEEEHYSAVTWQAFTVAEEVGAKPIFYTWQNIEKTYPPPFSWIERRIFRKAAAGVAGNEEAAQVLRSKGFRGKLVEIPQMGVELERFRPMGEGPLGRREAKRAVGLDADDFWLAFIGRVVAEKGVQDLLAALAHLSDKPRVKLLVLGDGPFLASLVELARKLEVDERVSWQRSVPSTDVPKYMRAVDVLCLPSHTRANWKEQFGRVLIEAMAAEALVLGSSSGEIPRVIGDVGLVHPEHDATSLSNAVRRLADSPELCARLRAKGSARVRERYTNERIAAQFAALFRGL